MIRFSSAEAHNVFKGSVSVIENSTVEGGEEAIGPKSNRKAFRALLVCAGTPSIESLLIG